MILKCLVPCGITLAFGLLGCATARVDEAWPEPRPLGSDLGDQPSGLEPLAAAAGPSELVEPEGILSLRHALALAMMKNPALAAFSWEMRAAEASVIQAGLLPNPELEVELEEFGGPRGRRGLEAAEYTLQLSQLVELGGKRSRRAGLADLERRLSRWDYESRRLDLFAKVTRAFVEVLAAQEGLTLKEELVDLASQFLDSVSEQVRAGKVSPVEETRAAVELSVVRIELERGQRSLESARRVLAATWGSTTPGFEGVAGELDRVATIPPGEWLAERLSGIPELARWADELKHRQAALKLELANRYPDLQLGGGVSYFEEDNQSAYLIGVSIPLPIFDRNQGGILQARSRLAQAREQKRAEEVRIRTALATAYQSLAMALSEATTLNRDVLPRARSVLEAARAGYLEGKFGYLDVLDAQRTLFEVREQHVKALASYHSAVAEVERLVGEPLAAGEPATDEAE